MTSAMRGALLIVVVGIIALAVVGLFRVVRVTRAAAAIPVYPGARESGGRTRYLPHLLSWDDRSSARVQRVFALPENTGLIAIARHADTTLAAQGWTINADLVPTAAPVFGHSFGRSMPLEVKKKHPVCGCFTSFWRSPFSVPISGCGLQ